MSNKSISILPAQQNAGVLRERVQSNQEFVRIWWKPVNYVKVYYIIETLAIVTNLEKF